ncbi:MAG: acyloxyacyl hydrolase [Bacteroidales bacterium]|nr:acyloxyacyl hydrolase [Bacteroidales bacterium]
MSYRTTPTLRSCSLLLWLLTPAAPCAAQLSSRLTLSLESRIGAVMPHHDYIAYFVERHITGFMLNVGIQTDGSKDWHARYNYPVAGVGYYLSNLGNNSVHGYLNGLYGYINFHFRPAHHRLNVGNRIALGLSYATEHHHPQINIRNYALSTSLNVFFQYDLLLRYQLSKQFDIAMMAGLTHASNGNLKEPNKGFNLLSASIAARYRIRPLALPIAERPTGSDSTKLGLLCGALFGGKAFRPNDNTLTPCLGLSIELQHRLAPSGLWGLELAMYHDRSLLKHYRFKHKTEDGFDPRWCYLVTLHPTYTIQAGRLYIAIQPGLYLNSGYLPNGRITNKLGLRYQILPQLLTSIAIKTHHFAQADFIELSIRYRIKLID